MLSFDTISAVTFSSGGSFGIGSLLATTSGTGGAESSQVGFVGLIGSLEGSRKVELGM